MLRLTGNKWLYERGGLPIRFKSDLGAALRQAASTALSTVASSADPSTTLVLPSRPQPPGTDMKTLGAACMNIDCCSDVRLSVTTVSADPPKVANVVRSTRNSDCPLRYTSVASGMDSAIRRKSSGVIALSYRLGIRRAIARERQAASI
jgi:hypothetical protein